MKLKPWSHFVQLVATVVLLNGCATSKLWEEGQFARFYEPAKPANLQLFHARQGEAVLVQYDEANEGNESIRRRAYWLKPGHEPEKNGHQPRFVSVETARDLSPIPVIASPSADPPTGIGFYAIVETKGVSFSIRSGEQRLGPYELPVYQDASGKTKQMLLTPFTVIADLTIIGGVIVIICWPVGTTIPL
jgi:hypothetical protein